MATTFNTGNHILVGLGGTGGKVLRAFKMRMFEEFTPEERAKKAVALVYVDSTDEMMPQGGRPRPDFRVMGQDASFTKNEFLNIKSIEVSAILDHPQNYPQVKGIIENAEAVRRAIGSLGQAAGQKRRAGRLLFAANAQAYVNSIKDAFARCQDISGETNELYIHIFAGLAGGTGSGSIIDALVQTRKTFPKANITVYAMIPEMYLPHSGIDQGRYYQNGYAALMELNALQSGVFMPQDVTGTGPINVFSEAAKGVANGLMLYSNVNENGQTLESFSELPKTVSDAFDRKLADIIRQKHSERIEADKKVLGMNILTQLRQKLTSDDEIKAFAHTIIKQSGVYLQLNPSQLQLHLRNNEGALSPTNPASYEKKTILVSTPSPEGDAGLVKFADKLEQALLAEIGLGEKVSIKVNRKSPRKDELSVLTLKYCFPMRAIDWLADYSQRYDRMINTGNPGTDAQNATLLHGEGNGKNLPSIFPVDKPQEVQEPVITIPTDPQPPVGGPQPPVAPGQPTVGPGMPPPPQQLPTINVFLSINGQQKKLVETYQKNFTEEGLPVDATADLSKVKDLPIASAEKNLSSEEIAALQNDPSFNDSSVTGVSDEDWAAAVETALGA